MVSDEIAGTLGMLHGDRQFGEALGGNVRGYVFGDELRFRKLAESILGGDLPGGHRAYENFSRVGCDRAPRATCQGRAAGEPPEERVRIEKQAQVLLPELQLVLGKLLEKLRSDFDLAFQATELAFGLWCDRNDLDHGLLAACEHDLLACLGAGNKLGEVRLGGVDRVGRHMHKLANLLS